MRAALASLFVCLTLSCSSLAEERVVQSLGEVKGWLLLLNNDLDDATVSRIAQSDHEMVVIDHISSQKNVAQSKSANVVEKLHTMPDGRKRLVIAYLNIGQAEDYRTYWQKGWKIGRPSFLLGLDPDGWEGNFPVAYWHKEWRARILSPGGLLASVQDAGFDGVYLDWIGGYEDTNVIAKARQDGIDPEREMIDWVREFSAAAKSAKSDFVVIAQNAAGLLADPKYLAAIDGVSHEDIWFTGADGGPESDCPVPKTTAEANSKIFISSLSRACRKAYERDAASAMRVAGEEAIVPALQVALKAGKPVFTVDYAAQAENVSSVVRSSRSFGFIPFVGKRNLSEFVDTPRLSD